MSEKLPTRSRSRLGPKHPRLAPGGSRWNRINYTAIGYADGGRNAGRRKHEHQGKSRRSFLLDSVTGVNAAWVAANYHDILAAQEYVRQAAKAGQPPQLAFFTDAQAAEIEAMTAQIIPTDESARRARSALPLLHRPGSVHFRAGQPARLHARPADLAGEDAAALSETPRKFSALNSAQQIKVLTAIEKTPFFNMVRTHTVIGFFARPVHGGNYDKIGWKLIGYDDSLNHKPPFGYYDALPQPRRQADEGETSMKQLSDINRSRLRCHRLRRRAAASWPSSCRWPAFRSWSWSREAGASTAATTSTTRTSG